MTTVDNTKNIKQFLTRTVSGTFGFKILNVGLTYANSLLIIRFVGAQGYGEYIYTISWIQILLIPAALGFEGLLNRELAVYIAGSQWNYAKGLLKTANSLVLLTSGLIAVTAFQVHCKTYKMCQPFG